jgi:hypothetical protein
MHSLVRISLLVVVLHAAGCGGTEPTPYIMSWTAPFSYLQGGTTAQLTVQLSMPVKDKTYVDITPNPGDELYVSTAWHGTGSQYIIIAAGASSEVVDITAQNVTHAVSVTLSFKIRDVKEARDFSFEIRP